MNIGDSTRVFTLIWIFFMKRLLKTALAALFLLGSSSAAFADEHQLGFSIGAVSGTYSDTDSSYDATMAGTVLDLPTYEYVMDNNWVIAAQYKSLAMTGSTTALISGWPVTLDYEYKETAILGGGGYRFEVGENFFITPAMLLGSASAEFKVGASLLGTNLLSETYTASGTMVAIEVPFMWRIGDNKELGLKVGSYSSGMEISYTNGTTGTVDVTNLGAFVMRWAF